MKRTKENVKVLKLKYDGEWVYELINENEMENCINKT